MISIKQQILSWNPELFQFSICALEIKELRDMTCIAVVLSVPWNKNDFQPKHYAHYEHFATATLFNVSSRLLSPSRKVTLHFVNI